MSYMLNETGACQEYILETGVRRAVLSYGEKTLLTRQVLPKDSEIPLHTHLHEQTGYLISGKLVMITERERKIILPGGAWCFPGHVPHGTYAMEDSVLIEIFTPVRKEYL